MKCGLQLSSIEVYLAFQHNRRLADISTCSGLDWLQADFCVWGDQSPGRRGTVIMVISCTLQRLAPESMNESDRNSSRDEQYKAHITLSRVWPTRCGELQGVCCRVRLEYVYLHVSSLCEKKHEKKCPWIFLFSFSSVLRTYLVADIL